MCSSVCECDQVLGKNFEGLLERLLFKLLLVFIVLLEHERPKDDLLRMVELILSFGFTLDSILCILPLFISAGEREIVVVMTLMLIYGFQSES